MIHRPISLHALSLSERGSGSAAAELLCSAEGPEACKGTQLLRAGAQVKRQEGLKAEL